MKFILALCLLGVACAAPGFFYTSGYPYAQGVVPYTAGVVPYAGAIPYSYGNVITYSAVPAVTSVVHPGYVAKTRGSTHIAPLPAGSAYASHHINVAPAPGTSK